MALLLNACGMPTQVPLPTRVEPQGLDAEQVAALNAATDDWYVASAGTIDLTNYAGEPLVVSAGLDDGDASGETHFHPGEPISISVNTSITHNSEFCPDRWQFVFEHEFGHALGLSHQPRSLMEANQLDARACVDAESLARACANYGGCNSGFHSTCED